MRLNGRVAIVTGAASGIGRASAQIFAREGAQVLAVDVPGKGIAEAHEGHQRIATLEKSVTDTDAVEAIIDGAVKRFRGLDILMNNAGVASNALAEVMAIEEWDRAFAVNVRAPFLLCQRAIPHLKQGGAGRIINVASVMA